jgi:hypothetical protein
MTFSQRHILMNLAAILLLAMPIYLDGFAPAGTAKRIIPNLITTSSSFDRNSALKSSAASTREIPPTIKSQGKLNKAQATVVKLLMIAYIASMCVALPA